MPGRWRGRVARWVSQKMSRLSFTGQPRHFFLGRIPTDVGAGSAGGFYAGQGGGFYAGQVVRPGRLLCRAGGAYAFEAAGWEAPMPGRWCGRGGFNAGQVARPGCPRDDDAPTLCWEPCICDIGATNVKEMRLGEPALIGEPVLIGRATQPLSQWPTTPAPAWRCACLAHLQVPAPRLLKCLLGTST